MQESDLIILFKAVTGSRLYGFHKPTSDTDIRGIGLPDKKYYLGFLHRFEQLERKDPDMVIYGLRKGLELMAKNNPNMIELLYVPKDKWLKSTPAWEYIVSNRDLFLSKKAYYTFSGYAFQQMKRMKNHKAWHDQNIPEKPKRSDYGLPEHSTISKEYHRALLSLPDDLIDPEQKLIVKRERKFKEAVREYDAYQKWLKYRNKERLAGELKTGYDLKHACHLYRLYVMCVEILKEGTIIVDRTDRDVQDYIDIRNGEWSYDKLMGKTEALGQEAEALYETSSLQKKPKFKKIDEMCQDIIEYYHFNADNYISAPW